MSPGSMKLSSVILMDMSPSLYLSPNQIKPDKEIVSDFVHRNHTGKKDRAIWNEVEEFLDEYLVDDLNWREHMGWEQNFINSNRGYLTIAIGYQIESVISIPHLQDIDTEMDDLEPLANFIIDVKNTYRNLFSL